jgi:hypothetical protein
LIFKTTPGLSTSSMAIAPLCQFAWGKKGGDAQGRSYFICRGVYSTQWPWLGEARWEGGIAKKIFL